MNDVLFDSNYDLGIVGGDFSIGDSTEQEVEDILLSYPGWWKEFPFLGVGAPSYLKSPGPNQKLQSSIRLQLISDGKQLLVYSTSIDANGDFIININGQQVNISQ